eukprot:COSAG01_NODE_6365_length_3710_cov_4.071429_6_plen_178_part_00
MRKFSRIHSRRCVFELLVLREMKALPTPLPPTSSSALCRSVGSSSPLLLCSAQRPRAPPTVLMTGRRPSILRSAISTAGASTSPKPCPPPSLVLPTSPLLAAYKGWQAERRPTRRRTPPVPDETSPHAPFTVSAGRVGSQAINSGAGTAPSWAGCNARGDPERRQPQRSGGPPSVGI